MSQQMNWAKKSWIHTDNEMPFISFEFTFFVNLICLLQMVFLCISSLNYSEMDALKDAEHFHKDKLACIHHKLIALF